MAEGNWKELGPAEDFKEPALREIQIGKTKVALSYANGEFGAVSGVCNHVGGPLGRGHLEGDHIECPWHYWKFHRVTGTSKWSEEEHVPRYELKVENGQLYLNLDAVTKRGKRPRHEFSLSRRVVREPGPIRVVGISTTPMTSGHPRYSTSEELLKISLASAAAEHGAETRLIRLSNLQFRNCEGFYSKSAYACIWPCSITRADKTDQLE